jgi:hypothetical protein
MECTVDNAFNLRDLVLEEMVKRIVVCYINLKIKTQLWYFIPVMGKLFGEGAKEKRKNLRRANVNY